MSSGDTRSITKDDLASKLREIQGEFAKAAEAARPAVYAVAVAVGVTIIAVAFLVGVRTGRKRSTFVEIKRI